MGASWRESRTRRRKEKGGSRQMEMSTNLFELEMDTTAREGNAGFLGCWNSRFRGGFGIAIFAGPEGREGRLRGKGEGRRRDAMSKWRTRIAS
jgi:hypothetical protein